MTNRRAKPVYVLYGTDEYLKAERRKALVAELIGGADPQTAVVDFDLEAEVADLLDELRTIPLLAPRRVVVIVRADAFVSANRAALERYLASPCASSTLILSVTAWPSNTKLYKLVPKAGEAINCSAPGKRGGLAAWLSGSAAKLGKGISAQAAQLLIDWVGDDMGALAGELEKLSLYIGDRAEITPEDVSVLVAATAGPQAFALTGAITSGDPAGALKALAGTVTRRGEEFRALGTITWHLRRAMRVQQAMAQGAHPAGACKDARVFAAQREFLDMLKRRPPRMLHRDVRKALSADLAMKTGADAMLTLQTLVVDLCR